MAEPIIQHLEHDGTLRDTFRPEELHFVLRLDEPSDIDYEASLAMPNMRAGFVGPYRTDFQLYIDGENVMGGLHTGYTVHGEGESITINGKDWMHYLEKRHYPFDPQAPNQFIRARDAGADITSLTAPRAPAVGIMYAAKDTDVNTIIEDLFDVTLGRPNSLDIFLATVSTGYTQDLRLDDGDETDLYSIIKDLSDEEPQFNFKIYPDRQFFVYPDHIYLDGAETDPSQNLWVFDDRDINNGVLDIQFTNDGPQYTHIMALGAGTSTKLGRVLGYDNNQQIYRRLDGVEDFGNVINRAQLNRMAQRALSQALYPVHEVTLTINPDAPRWEGENFWRWTFPGTSVWIRWDFEAASINHGYVITEMDCTIDTEGNPSVQLGLNEINPLGNPGSREA